MNSEQLSTLKRQLGSNIRLARLRQGLTQEEAARRIGISTEVYGRMERGGIFPRVTRLSEICEHLKVSADQLLSLAPAEKLPAAQLDSRWRDDWFTLTHRIVELVPKLSHPQRAAARRHLSELYSLLLAFVEPHAKQAPTSRSRRKSGDKSA